MIDIKDPLADLRSLEDEVSVAMGIGPVCAARLGWAR